MSERFTPAWCLRSEIYMSTAVIWQCPIQGDKEVLLCIPVVRCQLWRPEQTLCLLHKYPLRERTNGADGKWTKTFQSWKNPRQFSYPSSYWFHISNTKAQSGMYKIEWRLQKPSVLVDLGTTMSTLHQTIQLKLGLKFCFLMLALITTWQNFLAK